MKTDETTNHVHIHAGPAKPEVDPELAAMESRAVNRFIGSLMRRQPSAPANGPRKQAKGQGRTARRAMARMDSVPDPRKTPHARLGRSRLAAPVKGPKQLALELKAATRSYLSKVPVAKLVSECPEMKYVAGVPGIGDAWQLCQAATATIHGITGLGPARRRKIHAYLNSKNAPVAWTP